jgi:hypothetical protein
LNCFQDAKFGTGRLLGAGLDRADRRPGPLDHRSAVRLDGGPVEALAAPDGTLVRVGTVGALPVVVRLSL